MAPTLAELHLANLEIGHAVDAIRHRFGGIDMLVKAAGIVERREDLARALEGVEAVVHLLPTRTTFRTSAPSST